MTVKERLDAFQKENPPFYIVDHDDGRFSLCLPLDFLANEYGDYCQDAFDTFAESNGEPHIDDHHSSYGSGYDWQAAFAEAFKDDPNISRIIYDSECGGFYCYCDSLDIIEDFGKRFKSICEDYDRFAPIVADGMRNAEIREAEQERLMKTVKGQFMAHPKATFDILSPLGEIRVTPEMSKKLLAGEMPTVQIGGVQYADYELLDQPIKGQQTDIFNDNLIRMKTDEAPEPVEAPTVADEKLDVIEVLDRVALFSNGRILPEEVPAGLYAYDLRESDDGDRFCSVEKKVIVNHGGTILLKEPITFGDLDGIALDEESDPNFLGYDLTPAEFMQTDFTQTEDEPEQTECQQLGGM